MTGYTAEEYRLEEAEWDAYLEARDGAFYEIAELARVPEEKQEEFCREFYKVWRSLAKDIPLESLTRRCEDAALFEAKRAVRAAKDAVDKLSNDQRELIQWAMRSVTKKPFPAPADCLDVMVKAFAKMTAENPDVAPKGKGAGRGRRKGSLGNWKFQYLVKALFTLSAQYGQRLSLDDKNRDRGTILKALKILRQFIPDPAIIPNEPPLKTIAKIQRSCEAHPH
jgi:hypothetical protein